MARAGRIRFGAFLGLVLFVAQVSGASRASLRSRLYAVLQRPIFQGVKVGMEVELLGSRKKIFSYHANRPMTPASNMKILTTSCALLVLGPGYHFTTLVMGSPPEGGILKGNLIIKGGGDPTWNRDFYPDGTDPLMALAARLYNAGLRDIRGDLLVDSTIFDREYTGIGWKKRYQWDDYASEIAGLSLDYNEVTVSILPGAALRDPPRIQLTPDNQVLRVVNLARTTAGGTALYIHRQRLDNTVTITGAINRYSKGTSFIFNIHDPPRFVGSALKKILARHGIMVEGEVREIPAYMASRDSRDPVLARIQSPPLIKILHLLNKESINFLAEHIFRELGASKYGLGSIANGQRAVCDCLRRMGIKKPAVVMADGSGLSSLDRVSPQTLASVLQTMAVTSVGPEFKKTLPVGGVDGTLQYRLKGVNVKAKTGAIRHVSALSGYLVTGYGQTVVFSIILNDFKFSPEEADILIDKLVRVIAATRGPL